MKNLFSILSILILTLVTCFYFLLQDAPEQGKQVAELEVLCAAGLRRPVEEIAALYEEEYGVKIQLNYGGSGQLYGALKLQGGDLYIPADSSYIENAVKDGLVSESITLCYLTAGIVVPRGNPKNIQNLQDLTGGGLSVAIAERSAAVGQFTHKVLELSGLLKQIEAGNVSKFPTVNEVVAQVKLGSVDSGIIWDGLMSQYDELEFINVAEFDTKRKLATVGVIKSSKRPLEALQFAQYLAAAGKGGIVFSKHGFDVK